MDPALPLTPEERLLLALGRLEPSDAGRARAREAADADAFRWERVLDLAGYHRVHALLARNLDDDTVRDIVPGDVRARLLQIRMAAELRNERYAHACAEPFARLAADRVPVVLLKGAALAATVYPPGSRPLNDVDLLIRPEDYGRVTRVLEEARFGRIRRDDRTDREMLGEAHEATFARRVRNETLSLDLHWRLFAPTRATALSSLGFHLPVERILAWARPVAMGPAKALAPCAEHMIVHSATQIAIDSLQVHLGRLADLDALVARGPDWDRLVDVAAEAHAAGVTHLALSFVSMLGGRVPEDVLRRLRSACPPCGTASRVIATPSLPLERPALRAAARVALLPLLFGRPWQRLLYVVTLPFPTARTRGMHVLPHPARASDRLRRWRAVLLAAGCGAVLLAQRAADACGWRALAVRLRKALWHAASRPVSAPERVQREPAHV